jgi:hypothetical protein
VLLLLLLLHLAARFVVRGLIESVNRRLSQRRGRVRTAAQLRAIWSQAVVGIEPSRLTNSLRRLLELS